MIFKRLFLCALTLAAPGLGHPAKDRRSFDQARVYGPGQEPTVCDKSLTAPTQVPRDGGSEPSPIAVAVAGGQPQGPPAEASSDGPKADADSNLPGISYAPYRADHSCKTAKDINNDFERFKGDYSLVRIYGTDCDQVPRVYSAAKKIGVKLMVGIWDINSVKDEASKIINGIDNDWGMVHSVGVGNELVNNGEATAQEVTNAVDHARHTLRKAGYNGPVVTVDTFTAVKAHPELCEHSDFCAINAHAFFDSNIDAPGAGKWLKNTVQQVKSSLKMSKHVIVTETGWPTGGATNGLAVPSLKNQETALGSIRNSFSDHQRDVILFSAFDDLWKQKTMSTFNADQNWGIGGAISNSDRSFT